MKNFLLIVLMLALGQQSVNAQKALKVYIVRHAEKMIVDPKDSDPLLSEEGAERAMALLKELKGSKIDSIYATNYKRTKLTAFPLADKLGLSIKTYNPAEQKELAKQLITYGEDKVFLIVGHSNTVLDIVEAFGATKPVKELTDDDYDYLFEVTVKGKKSSVNVSRFGKSHHSGERASKAMKSLN